MAWVLEPGVELKLSMVDASGHRATESYFLDTGDTDPTAGGAAAIAGAVQGISADAVTLVECIVRASESTPAAATDGPYARGADKVKLTFQASDGSEITMEIGAPNEGILDTDKINVDKADTAITELLDILKTNAVSAEGATYTALKRGFRKRNAGVKHL